MISGLDWPGEWQLRAGLGLGVDPEVSEKVKERRLHSAAPQPPFSKTSSGKVDWKTRDANVGYSGKTSACRTEKKGKN